MPAVRYSDASMMAYEGARRVFRSGEPLVFDEAYRLAHLPLVSPDNPAVIARKDGKDYMMGRYARPRYSAVVPIDQESLSRSAQFREMEADLRARSFSCKVQWDICRLRKDVLHATVIGGISEAAIPATVQCIQAALASLPPVSLRIGGPFLGRVNTGRVYFPLYPQLVDGRDALSVVQEACGAKVSRFFVVGYYNLAAELSVDETDQLARFAERWCERVIAHQQLTGISILATNDDLVLSARIVASVPARA